MSIFAATFPLTIFSVEGDMDPIGDVIESLNQFQFRPIFENSDPSSLGWVPNGIMNQYVFQSSEEFYNAPYVLLTLRKDVRSVPYATKLMMIAAEEKRWLEDNGQGTLKRVPKRVKEEIAERVTVQLLGKTMPAPTLVDVVWDTTKNQIYLLSSSARWVDDFTALWERTFPNNALHLCTPFNFYYNSLPEEKSAELEVPRNFSEYHDLYSGQNIGENFLLWLVYKSANPEEGQEVHIGNRITFANKEDARQTLAIGGDVKQFDEIRAAIAAGKLPTSANLLLQDTIVDTTWEWSMTLKGATFQFEAFKSPKVMLEQDGNTDNERQALFYEKMYLLEKGLTKLNDALAAFAKLHSTNWAKELIAIGQWAADGE